MAVISKLKPRSKKRNRWLWKISKNPQKLKRLLERSIKNDSYYICYFTYPKINIFLVDFGSKSTATALLNSGDFIRDEFKELMGRFKIIRGSHILKYGLDSLVVYRKRVHEGTPFTHKGGITKKFILPKNLDANAGKRLRQKIRRRERKEIKATTEFPQHKGITILPKSEVHRMIKAPYRVFLLHKEYNHYARCFQPAPTRAMRKRTLLTLKKFTKYPKVVEDIANISRTLVKLNINSHPYLMGELAISFYLAYKDRIKEWNAFWVKKKGVRLEDTEIVNKEFAHHGFISMERFKAKYGRLKTEALVMSLDEQWVLPIPLWHSAKMMSKNLLYSYTALDYYGIPGYTKVKILESESN